MSNNTDFFVLAWDDDGFGPIIYYGPFDSRESAAELLGLKGWVEKGGRWALCLEGIYGGYSLCADIRTNAPYQDPDKIPYA